VATTTVWPIGKVEPEGGLEVTVTFGLQGLVAVTVKVTGATAALVATTVWSGGQVMVGGGNASVAASLVVLPKGLLTTTVYCPRFAVPRFARVSELVVAPEILLPFKNH
jgi:hypothetical protein